MKVVVSLLVALAIAAGAWWLSGADSDESQSDVVDATEESFDNTSAVKADEAGETSDSEDSAKAVIESDDAELNADTVAVETVEDSVTTEEESPFAVVGAEEDSQVPAEAELDVQTQIELPDADDPDAVSESAQRSAAPLEVPSSYPVTDAAKYFIPKEERGPGNLGGPPPLDFPGGPSDPNRESSDGLQPPSAPGQ